MAPPKKMATPKSAPGKVPLKNEPEIISKVSRSPGRSKSPGRPKSTSKTRREPKSERSVRMKKRELSKSPARSEKRAGHLTPTRRSPIKKSSSQSFKEKEKSKESSIPILNKKKKYFEVDTDSDSSDEKVEREEKPKAAVKGRARIDFVEKVEIDKEPIQIVTPQLVKRVTRLQQKEIERIVHLKHFEPVYNKRSGFSDEDEFVKEPPESAKTSKSVFSKFAEGVGIALILFLFPALGFYLYSTCEPNNCSFKLLPAKPYKFLSTSVYFDVKAALAFLCYILLLAILDVLPFSGWKVTALPDKHGKFVYVINGLFSAVVVFSLSAVLEYFDIQVFRFVLVHEFHLFISAFIIGVSISVFVYIRSFYAPISALNPQIIDKNKIRNFVIGRELHPRIFNITDLKMFVNKYVLISKLILTAAYLYEIFEVTKSSEASNESLIDHLLRIQPTLVVYSFLQIIRLLDRLFYERAWVTSKTIQQEGLGYTVTVNCFLCPFIQLFVMKFIVKYNVQFPYWQLAVITVLFLIGHFIARISNNIKDGFRKNPYNPSFSKLETIPTNQGKKLLTSGLWGFVRHPNYLGDILCELVTIPFVLCTPAVILQYINILFLIHRAHEDNGYCKQKYGVSWDRYCNRVRYLLVPKVF
ncbi:delta(14)-sterol reductase TM7SF2 [Euwallacea fornicatus]|uniref:delta(14)-sterol reductase TM7SF2 n=1 Tax=Euwallacea fornicatus TaxID=995702 RepID=UPI0033906C11